MNNLDVLNYGNKLLKSSNISSYKLDSELILAKVLNYTREKLLINLDKKLEKKIFKNYKYLINRRKKNEPMAQIFENKEFWKYNFFVNRNVLIPRPETELIVEEVLKLTNYNSSKHILDIGTGSGCIIISILKNRPFFHATALDISSKAIKIAVFNAKMHHLENKIKFINIDVDKFNLNKYDFIVSNPPYIKKLELMRLSSNVRLYEPKIALEAGIDGFKEIKKIILKSKKLLKKNGKLIFEIGDKQKENSLYLLKKNGFYINKVCSDTSSIPRVLISTKIDNE
tara:strand:+ start:771 stop:1622 length:852 start_codon:yes stop_codon:yes gene_type:complete